ncbi:MAG TPA: alpha/beta hydrolase [Myxococcota bacterium]|jgi:pimeloyl-ACP methyl ester carboxylesterase
MWQTREFTSSDGLTLSYRDYTGPPVSTAAPVLCLPGLTRNARDFESLASELARSRRVLSPDLRGRGLSAFDPQPARYHPATYVRDVIELLAAAHAPRVLAIGTSLGGLITLLLAGAKPDALAGVVLNDIGPVVEEAGLARIRGYVGKTGAMRSWDEAAGACRAANAVAFPDFSAADWLSFARRCCVATPDGGVRFDYDPRISEPLAGSAATPPASDPWQLWSPLARIATLVIRGAHSDILSAETVAAMQRRKPDTIAVTVPGRGHAPLLDEPEALAAIRRFAAAR